MRLKSARWLLFGLWLPAFAAPTLPLQGTATLAFSPSDDAGALIVEAIGQARQQILVQAYTFTHRAIAEALANARRRGIDIRVIADMEQAGRVETSLIDWLAQRDVPVYLDGQHAAAHNKTIVIDAGQADAIVITGSYNFTHSAQYRNAENLLILRGNPALAEGYAADWQRHHAHAVPVRK
ncbi:MAG: phospholipase D family protein [Hydrogenophilales bacterium]|nr:phospholipase D family protein [Hydrogenophilales bacterium]